MMGLALLDGKLEVEAVEVEAMGRWGEVPPGAETADIEGWEPFAWKNNGLRHSFISYRLAAIQNTAQVALEAGNSPQMIFQHYRELVRPAEAEKWFAVTPASARRRNRPARQGTKPENVIPFQNVAQVA